MPLKPEIIAAILGVFFILAAVIKAVVSNQYKRKIANQKAALAAGGTEESPVQLHNPFNEQPAARPAVPAPQPAPQPAAPVAPIEAPKPAPANPYAWE